FLETFIGVFILFDIVVHIVVTHHIEPRETHLADSLFITRVQGKIIANQISKADSKKWTFSGFRFAYYPIFEEFHFLRGICLEVTKNKSAKVSWFFLHR